MIMKDKKEIKILIPTAFRELYNDNYRYKLYHGGRGGAKSWSFAIVLLLMGIERPLRILCCREKQNSIRDSVHKLLKDLIDRYGLDDVYKVTNESIVNTDNGTEFIFKGLYRNATEIKSMEGIDICWGEEAQSFSEESLNLLVPTIRKEGSQIWFSYNRMLQDDPVHSKFAKNPSLKTFVKKVTWRDNPFFSSVQKADMLHCKETNYDLYNWIWEGEPIKQGEKCILSSADIRAAMNRRIENNQGSIEYGCDVARFGDDRTTIYRKKGLCIDTVGVLRKKDTVEVARYLMSVADKGDLIKVDDTGVGGGVTDTLKHNGYNVIGVNFNDTKKFLKNPDKYPNLISEMWFECADKLPLLSIPNDEELLRELSTREWEVDSKSRRCVVSKKKYKEDYGESPDKADGFLLSIYDLYVKNPRMRQL